MGQYIKQVNCHLCGGRGGTYYSDGYVCYSCGANVNLKATITKKPHKEQKILQYPEGIEYDPEKFTLEVRKWLNEACISNYLINKYNIGCIPDKNAVFLPIIVNKELKNYTLRFFGKQKRKYKYLTRGSKKATKVLLGEEKLTNMLHKGEKATNMIVLVEDYLSCIRVAEFLPCQCLQGTSISDTMINALLKRYDTILIWTDADEGGETAAKKIEKRCRALYKNHYINNLWAGNDTPLKVKRIKTAKDPKLLTNGEMYEVITSRL
jgi:hypothetical protein